MCFADINERCTVYTVTPRKARKDHWCRACDRAILAGYNYEEHTSLFEGEWSRSRVHPTCHLIVEEVMHICHSDYYSMELDNAFHYFVVEHLREYPEAATANLRRLWHQWGADRQADARTRGVPPRTLIHPRSHP